VTVARGYTGCMTHRVGPKGQVVIPKPIRDAVGLRPGDAVDFELEDGVIRVHARRPIRDWMGAFAGQPLTEELEADRRAEPR
jgi:antitoxin PrlF